MDADVSQCVSELVLCVAVCVSEGRKALWDDYTSGSKKRRHLLQSRYGRINIQGTVVDSLSEDWINVNSKHCPHCFCRIQVFIYSPFSLYVHTQTKKKCVYNHIFMLK